MKATIRSTMGIALAATLFLGTAASPVAIAGSSKEHSDSKVSTVFSNGITQGKLEASILLNEHISVFDIDTDVENGVVTLTGTVSTEVEKDIAEQVALGIDGVTKVKNQISVDAKTTAAKIKQAGNKMMDNLSDVKVTAMIESKFAVNEHLSALDIDVDTDNRKVTLQGTVETEQLRELAELVAENTEGVVDVENRLKVSADIAML